jgi:hypothetical protein
MPEKIFIFVLDSRMFQVFVGSDPRDPDPQRCSQSFSQCALIPSILTLYSSS